MTLPLTAILLAAFFNAQAQKLMHIAATAMGTSTQLGRIVNVDLRINEFSTPEDQKGQTIIATRDDTSIASTFSGTLKGKKFEVSIVPEKCSDGMSDTEYPFSAWLSTGGAMRHGCAK